MNIAKADALDHTYCKKQWIGIGALYFFFFFRDTANILKKIKAAESLSEIRPKYKLIYLVRVSKRAKDLTARSWIYHLYFS